MQGEEGEEGEAGEGVKDRVSQVRDRRGSGEWRGANKGHHWSSKPSMDTEGPIDTELQPAVEGLAGNVTEE